MVKLLQEISGRVEKGDSARVKELVEKGISLSLQAERILNLGLIEGMNRIGERFKRNEVFIPEVLMASRAMKAGMDLVRLHLPKEADRLRDKILLATVKGDLHDIGKKIVGMMLEGTGFNVIDIGADVSKETVVKWIKKENPRVVGLSALLTTTMTYMGEIIEAVDKSRFRPDVKVIVGGAPVTKLYADEVGADGYAPDGASAAALVKTLLLKRPKSSKRGLP